MCKMTLYKLFSVIKSIICNFNKKNRESILPIYDVYRPVPLHFVKID